ncbi:MAG: vitamin B12 dependent-methionine synthase activation domain-containing protein [Candidatus Eisenbacteria bacterium]
MDQIFDIPRASVAPTEDAVLRAMGVPGDQDQGPRVARLVARALDELRGEAEPRGIVAEVDTEEFAVIYEGAGDNDHPSPLREIFPRAESLTLFAVTLGSSLSDRVSALFDGGELALATTLDAAASEGTELAGVHMDGVVLADARASGRAGDGAKILRYSPGYCGWNLTGQRALFAALRPEKIGIRLTDSCLMEPIKSISGVMVAGSPEIHDFDDDYDFCSLCRTRDCRRRIQGLNVAGPPP